MIRTLQFTTYITRPISEVYDHMADPHNLIGLQPLLIEMSPVQSTRVNGVIVQTYETIEAFRLGGYNVYRNRIRVRTTLTRPNEQIDSLVHSPGGVTLDVGYTFTPQAGASQCGGTQLTEVMEINAPRLMAGFVVRQATLAQQAVMQRLKARLEAA